ncbi:unnamed protein product [Closterium sp. NIES-65]|nr:unnamed protein product [Closterium sp. NIES-65]
MPVSPHTPSSSGFKSSFLTNMLSPRGIIGSWRPPTKVGLLGQEICSLQERYLVKQEIGSGSYGMIRAVREKETGKTWACKSIGKEQIQTKAAVAALRQEVAVMQLLKGHPHVVEIKEAVEDDTPPTEVLATRLLRVTSAPSHFALPHAPLATQLPSKQPDLPLPLAFPPMSMPRLAHQHVHMIMDLCHGDHSLPIPQNPLSPHCPHPPPLPRHGGDLFDRIKQRSRYEERPAAAVLQQLALVLRACHSLGVMHRDVKPENLLLCSPSDDVAVKVTDFGIAASIKSGAKLTEFIGSHMYMAPEVINKSYSAEADIWSAGVVLYVLLAGVPPFWASTESGVLDAIVSKPLNFSFPPWPSISTEAKDLIKDMLKKDPVERITLDAVLALLLLKYLFHEVILFLAVSFPHTLFRTLCSSSHSPLPNTLCFFTFSACLSLLLLGLSTLSSSSHSTLTHTHLFLPFSSSPHSPLPHTLLFLRLPYSSHSPLPHTPLFLTLLFLALSSSSHSPLPQTPLFLALFSSSHSPIPHSPLPRTLLFLALSSSSHSPLPHTPLFRTLSSSSHSPLPHTPLFLTLSSSSHSPLPHTPLFLTLLFLALSSSSHSPLPHTLLFLTLIFLTFSPLLCTLLCHVSCSPSSLCCMSPDLPCVPLCLSLIAPIHSIYKTHFKFIPPSSPLHTLSLLPPSRPLYSPPLPSPNSSDSV